MKPFNDTEPKTFAEASEEKITILGLRLPYARVPEFIEWLKTAYAEYGQKE